MKLLSYLRDASPSCGVLTAHGVVDIPSSWKTENPPKSVKEILDRGPSCLDQVRQIAAQRGEGVPPLRGEGILPSSCHPSAHVAGKEQGQHALAMEATPLEAVKLLAPILRPGKILALAGNYSEHIKEASLQRGFELGLSDSPRQTTTPRPFLMPATCVTGPDTTVPWPVYSEQIDYELELAVIIGRPAKCVTAEAAPGYIAGYTIANDVSGRSVTFKKGRQQRPWDEFYDWLNGKWADGFCPMGPYLVTKDEIPDVQNLKMVLKVNGETRQNANTGQMIYAVVDIVSFLSHLMTLEPGDVICTGTPSGVAMATGNFLKPGDRIECAIENLGALTNTLGPRPTTFYQPLTRC